MRIHPTALVDPKAELGRDVEIGALSIVGPNVVLGDECKLHHHTSVEGHTRMGEGCEVLPQAVIGQPPQDLKYRGERTTLEIGRNNLFREMVTVHLGTENGGGVTRIGDGNMFMVGAHVAHDCQIGDGCILSNYVQLAGHVHVEDHVNLGGHSAVHHFVTLGKNAFIGGMTRIVADVPPFLLVVAARGTRSEIRMVNGVGLQRCGYSNEDINALKETFIKLFSRRARMEGTAIRDRVQTILDTTPINPQVTYLCEFLMRSFAHGRHGRYLESLRADPVRRDSWKLSDKCSLTIMVEGRGTVQRNRLDPDNQPHPQVELTASADPGWVFGGWNGGLSGKSNPVRVTLNSDMRVTATFMEQS